MSQLNISTLANLAGSETTPIADVVNGSARAWVNFNGTGTVAIRASYNVSSVTDFLTGAYGVNFINDMPDTNYSVVTGGSTSDSITNSPYQGPASLSQTVGSVNIATGSNTVTRLDWLNVNATVFR